LKGNDVKVNGENSELLTEEDKKVLQDIENAKKDLENELLGLKTKLLEQKTFGDNSTNGTNKRKHSSEKKLNKREKRMKKEHDRFKRSSLSKSATQPLQINPIVSNQPHTAETPVEQLIPTDFHFFIWMVTGRVRCRISPSWIAPKVDQKSVATHIAAKFALEPVNEPGVYHPINKREKIADVRNRLMNSGFIEDLGLDPEFK